MLRVPVHSHRTRRSRRVALLGCLSLLPLQSACVPAIGARDHQTTPSLPPAGPRPTPTTPQDLPGTTHPVSPVASVTPAGVPVEFAAGQRLEEYAGVLDRAAVGISGAQLLDAANRGTFSFDFLQDKPPGATLIGYLLPGTYHVLPQQTSAESLVLEMLRRFGEVVTADVRARARAGGAGLNTHQLVTLASIVQRVAPGDADVPAVAALLLGRVRAGECLCVDPPLQYVLGGPDQWWPPLIGPGNTVLRESPYNTYTHHALPPGPICNPGAGALQTVAQPAR